MTDAIGDSSDPRLGWGQIKTVAHSCTAKFRLHRQVPRLAAPELWNAVRAFCGYSVGVVSPSWFLESPAPPSQWQCLEHAIRQEHHELSLPQNLGCTGLYILCLSAAVHVRIPPPLGQGLPLPDFLLIYLTGNAAEVKSCRFSFRFKCWEGHSTVYAVCFGGPRVACMT